MLNKLCYISGIEWILTKTLVLRLMLDVIMMKSSAFGENEFCLNWYMCLYDIEQAF